jgi:predicted metal-binding membrane protein
MAFTSNPRYDSRTRALLVAAVCSLSLLAWIALWQLSDSPNLHHHHGSQDGIFARTFFWFFVLGWTVMAVAMMLPSSVPLLLRFHQISADRRDRSILVATLVAGYLGAWILFGAIVYAAATGAAQLIAMLPEVVNNQWLLGGFTLAVAGTFQFTRLKHQCLDMCKSPSTFITRHWSARGRLLSALRLGVVYGVFCIGCCWALMLLMFLVSVGNLAWMLVLAAIMTAEKSARGGRRLSVALGVVLLGAGTLMLALGLGSSLYGK